MKLLYSIACTFLLCCFMSDVAAAPDGAALVAACNHALSHGFRGPEAGMCTWYVTPCDCQHGDKSLPRVCLPHDADEEELAKLVTTALQQRPDLLHKPADFAADTVLVETYPCPE